MTENRVYMDHTDSTLFVQDNKARIHAVGETAHYVSANSVPPGLVGLKINRKVNIGSIPHKMWKPLQETYEVTVEEFKPSGTWELIKSW